MVVSVDCLGSAAGIGVGGEGFSATSCGDTASVEPCLTNILHNSVLASTLSPSGTISTSNTPATGESTGMAVCKETKLSR